LGLNADIFDDFFLKLSRTISRLLRNNEAGKA